MPAPPPPAPIIEVAHLPSASSFYAAVTQPLGLQYLFSSPAPPPPSPLPSPSLGATPQSLHFGILTHLGPQIIFSLVSRAVPRPSYITLTAASPKVVADFHEKSVLARKLAPNSLDIHTDQAIACTRDFDGNMIEAVYSSRGGRRAPTIHTVASEKDARRVLEWQEDVARSISDSSTEISASPRRAAYHPPPGVTYHRADSYPQVASPPLRLVRRETVTTEHYRHDDSLQARPAMEETGLSKKSLIGTVLGAAAGAAIAYAMVRSESPERIPPPVVMSRRASHGGSRPTYRHAPAAVEYIPARSYVSARDAQTLAPRRPEYFSRHTAPAPVSRSGHAHDLGRIEEGSRHASRYSSSARTRSRSEVGGGSSRGGGSRYERPLTILPPRARSPGSGSHRSSQKSSHHGHSKAESKASGREREREQAASYISARSGSHRTESTVKPARSSRVKTEEGSAIQYITASPPSRTSTSTSTTTIRVMGSPRAEEFRDDRASERRSVVSARHIPLPRSVVSGTGYAASVAPSDSVSSVGSKRERERLRERMGRGGAGLGLGY